MLDLLIKNAKTVMGDQIDIGISRGKIEEISADISSAAAQEIDLQQRYYVSAGWIDGHVHCNHHMPLYYDEPDEVGVKKGVTTVIDAGSNGADTMNSFYDQVQSVRTNVYALINISKTGIVAQNELSDMHNIEEELVKKQVRLLPDFILGLKARMSRSVVGDNDYQPLLKAKEIQEDLGGMPLMIHVGSQPPLLDEVLKRLDERDILTHCFNGKENGIVDEQSQAIKRSAMDAYRRGVRFDVGHGTDSFSFETAVSARKAGLVPHTVSTDIYYRNRESGPVHDLATTMEKMLVVGYSLAEVIVMVTRQVADNFNLRSKGRLGKGYDADITVFSVEQKRKELLDSQGQKRLGIQSIKPVYAIVGGEVYDI